MANIKPIHSITARAPGKIIISGEHSVVYGYPALVASVNLYLTVTFTNSHLQIKSDIPVGCGLGSSAALAAAKAAINLKRLDRQRINQFAFEAEKGTHGTPSGADNTAVVYGGWLKFQKPNQVTRFNKLNFPDCLLINTGKPTETTAQMIDYVSHRKPSLFAQISTHTDTIVSILTSPEPDFNQLKLLIRSNELLLEQLGIVSPSAQKIIRQIEQSGGVAKVCGAGGRTGASGIILCLHSQPQQLVKLAKNLKLQYFYPVRLGVPGISLRTRSTPRHREPATAAIPR